MIAFIDDHREAHGVEPICKVLPIAPSTYHEHAAKRADPAKLSARAKRDVALKAETRRVFGENFEVYGVRKVWRQLRREGFDIARCTVERLMRSMGLRGVIRGKPVKTTVSDKAAPCPLDHVKRQFRAPRPNVLWSLTSPMWPPGRALFMWRSSSIHSPVASWDGAAAARRIRALSSMPWSRRCTIGGPSIAAGSCITAIRAAKADSCGRRNRRFVSRSKQLVKRLRRRSPIERLSGPRIEGCCNGCNRLDAVDAKIGTFWEVLA